MNTPNQPDEPKPIAVGDQVRWTHISLQGFGASLVVRQGTVTDIAGDTATVQPLNKRSRVVHVKVAQLEAERKETAIKAIVDTMMGRNKPDEHHSDS